MKIKIVYNGVPATSVDMSAEDAVDLYLDVRDKRKNTITMETNYAVLTFPVAAVSNIEFNLEGTF